MRRSVKVVALLLSLFSLPAVQMVTAQEESRENVKSYPKWIKATGNSISCGQNLSGSFTSKVSAYSYTLSAQKAYTYVLTYTGSHAADRGSAIAIFNAKDKKRVASEHKTGSNSVSLSFTPKSDGEYLLGLFPVKAVKQGNYTVSLICLPVGANELKPGQTDFTSRVPASSSTSPSPRPTRGVIDREGPALPPAAPPAPAPAPMPTPAATPAPGNPAAQPPQGRTGPVEEADIYKIDKNRFFYLNTYKGFMIYDISDTRSPRFISKLPVFGRPVEMFIQDSTVYALIQDALTVVQKGGEFVFERQNVSQLISIDISDLSRPRVLQRFDIVGKLREGLSRKVEDTIYVVPYVDYSYYYGWGAESTDKQKEQAWVYSFNVANPQQLKLVDRMEIFNGGNESSSGGDSHSSRYFQSVAISATSNTLMVVENWNVYQSVYGSRYSCGSSISLQQAVVSIVDVSDPTGKIRLHTKFETYGHLGDQFKHTYIFDEKSGRATYLGIFARREWASFNCTGASRIENSLESWDVTDGKNPKLLDTLQFGKPNETVRGSVFDVRRGVAFAITAVQVDPLYALGFSDPSNLKKLSEVDGLSGDMNVFRFIENNRFLMAIGVDNSKSCTGFDTTGRFVTNVAASIIDVQDLNKIRLVQRRCVEAGDTHGVSSQVNWNRDQAHKMIGMHSDGRANVLTIPVQYSRKTDEHGWYYYRYETAVGMMSWDLSKYDPTKDEKNQDVIQTHGTVLHPAGYVKRTIIFSHDGPSSGRKLLNLSDSHYSLTDINNLERPVTESVVEVAPLYVRAHNVGNYIVEQIQPSSSTGSYNAESITEFRVKPANSDLENTDAIGRFVVGQVQKVIPHKKSLVVIRQDLPHLLPDRRDGKSIVLPKLTPEALVYDISDPSNPRRAATIQLPEGVSFPWSESRSEGADYPVNLYNDNTVVTDAGLLILVNRWVKNSYEKSIFFLDLRNPSSASLKQYKLSSDSSLNIKNIVSDTEVNSFLLNYSVRTGEKQLGDTYWTEHKDYVQRWHLRGDDFVRDYVINIPGQALRSITENEKKLFVCLDRLYDRVSYYWNNHPRLSTVEKVGESTARLTSSHLFKGRSISQIIVSHTKLFLTSSEAYRYDYYPTPPPSSFSAASLPPPRYYSYNQRLEIFDLAERRLKKVFEGSVDKTSISMLAHYRDKLFLSMSGSGVLALDVKNPARPIHFAFVRTDSYSFSVDFADRYAYITAGQFGVYQIDLEAGGIVGTIR
jgi:hypothetical protein